MTLQNNARAARLASLRSAMVEGAVDFFLIPRSDAHRGEYVSPRDERLFWTTGFDGSAGLAIVGRERAAIFVDGRYTIQVRGQVDEALFEIRHLIEEPPAGWLAKHAPRGGKVGYDPWLHTPAGLAPLKRACARAGADLVPVDRNPVDVAWADQPSASTAPFFVHPIAFAGKPAEQKRAEIAAKIGEEGADAVFLCLPDSIAWLLNIRGGDVPRAPMPHAFAVLHADGTVDLCALAEKIGEEVKVHLGPDVRRHGVDSLGDILEELSGKTLMLDPASAPDWVFRRAGEAGVTILKADDPVQLPKACKNEAELDGARAAHRRDGVAMSRFLHWIDEAAADGTLSEREAADRLEAFRRESNLLRDLSFDTISAAGPHAAIPHYRVTEESDRLLEANSIYLVDSGGQYPDGTTDITRTIVVGAPSPSMRRHYTLVLKGHIALARAIFPKGTTGSALDALARGPLWQAGLDFDHGTGHGVGSYLSVHEGPQRISKVANNVALQPGMIISNEPGYYRAGEYGIRIENLVAVVETEVGGNSMLAFETLTLAPIDKRLIDPELLDGTERDWFDAYHQRVLETHRDKLPPDARSWLERACAPL